MRWERSHFFKENTMTEPRETVMERYMRDTQHKANSLYDAGYRRGEESGFQKGYAKREEESLADDSKSYDNLVPTYEDGLNEAWSVARKIALNVCDDGIGTEVLSELFDGNGIYGIFQNYDIKEVIKRFAQHDADQASEVKIEVGDIVEDNAGTKVIVTCIYESGRFEGVNRNGHAYRSCWLSDWKKTDSRNYGELLKALSEQL